jgi:hypothetical protein
MLVSVIGSDGYNAEISDLAVHVNCTRSSIVIMGYQLIETGPTAFLAVNPDFTL